MTEIVDKSYLRETVDVCVVGAGHAGRFRPLLI